MYGSKRMCSINWTLITNCTKKIGRWTPVPPPVIRTGGSPLSRLGEPVIRTGGARYPDWGEPVIRTGGAHYPDWGSPRCATETVGS